MKFIFSLLLVMLALSALAQNIMQQRPTIDWKQVESKNFVVVYPDDHFEVANRVINLLEHYRDTVSEDYKVDVEKITLILHDHAAESNGFVTLAPRRSEWYMTPPLFPSLGSTEWYQTLSIHEYRHVVQFEKMRTGFNKYLHWILGDTGLQLGMVLAAPSWYYEGDAVVTETEKSEGGRGRSSDFSMITRSILLNDEKLDYETLFSPNYNHVLPNHYEYGYFSIAKLKKDFNAEKLNELIRVSLLDSYWPFTYYNSYPLVMNKKFLDFHNEMVEELREKLKEEERNKTYTQTETLYEATKEKGFTSIDQFKVSDNGLYFIKRDFSAITGLYHQDQNGKTKHIRDLNYFTFSERASFSKNKLIYAGSLPVMRYAFESTSDLYLVDLKSGKEKKITSNKRLFHPSLNSDETKVVAIEHNHESFYDLKILDLKGRELQKVSLKNFYPSYPLFESEKSIILILQSMQGKRSIARLDLETQNIETLTNYSFNQISNIKLFNNELFYERDFEGKLEAFKLNLTTRTESLLTSSQIAARSPYVYNDELYFVDYSRLGYSLKKAPLKTIETFSIKDIEASNANHIATDLIKKSLPTPRADELQTTHTEKDFSRFEDLFNFHSWTLIPLPGMINLEATSNNLMNTMALTAGYSYSSYEKESTLYTAFHYTRFWPILSVGFSWGQRKLFEDSKNEIERDSWDETILLTQVTLPFVLDFKTFNQNLMLSGGWNLLETSSRRDNSVYEATGNTMAGPTYRLSYNLTKKMALRDINPSYGIELTAVGKHFKSTRGNDQEGFSNLTSATLYLPSFEHTSIRLHGAQEIQKSFFDYRLPTTITKVRGHDYRFAPHMKTASFDFFFPISYPDFSFSKWYYLNRIYASVFYDYGRLSDDITYRELDSAGLDIYFESKFLRLLPLDFGVRFAQTLDEGNTEVELFLATVLTY